VVINEIVERPISKEFNEWNPKVNPRDGKHPMPVITPAFPCMNSTHNVSESSKKVILEEMELGLKIVEEIRRGNAS